MTNKTCTACQGTTSKPNWYKGPTCSACYAKARRVHTKEAQRAYNKQYWQDNKEERKRVFKEWLSKNKDHNRERVKEWIEKNRERMRELDRARYQRDKAKRIAACRARETGLKQATPAWLTEEHKQQMSDIYMFRHPDYHVDHIVPLKGKNVCGLNVPWNLQYLLAEENRKKSNKF